MLPQSGHNYFLAHGLASEEWERGMGGKGWAVLFGLQVTLITVMNAHINFE